MSRSFLVSCSLFLPTTTPLHPHSDLYTHCGVSGGGVSGSGSSTGELGHYGSHPRPQVADRGTPSRMDKRVAPDKEGAADKQCLKRRKTLIPNRGRWSSLSLFRQIRLGKGKL